MENGPLETIDFLLKMVIFHCYVTLLEGIAHGSGTGGRESEGRL